MTWLDGDGYNRQFYAQGTVTVLFLTIRLFYNVSRDGIMINSNGQGNAPYVLGPGHFRQ